MQPVTEPIALANSSSFRTSRRSVVATVVGVMTLAALSACDLPFDLGQPTTRALETGASDGLTTAQSFEVIGSYIGPRAALPVASAARTSGPAPAAVERSGPTADVYIAVGSPYRVLRVHLKSGVAVDGISAADLRYSNFDKDFGIAVPTDVIDFSNLSTLTPIYTVLSVDTSGCGSPCIVSASLKNLGGMRPPKGTSMITSTMTDAATGRVLGSCQAPVQPDVGFNSTTNVSCTIGGLSGAPNAAIVTATADNPGQA